MDENKNNSRFSLGLVIGSVVGAVAGLLLSPKSGKQNRDLLNQKMTEWKKMMDSGELEKKVKQIFGDVSDESVRMYAMAREKVTQSLEQLKTMDGDDYAQLVQKVMDEIKKHSKASADKMKNLQQSLIEDAPEMKKEVEKQSKKIASRANGQAPKKAN